VVHRNGRSYSSSLNIFAVVSGILLVRGRLKAARWVATASTFILVACAGLLLVMPFMYPIGYWLAVLRSGITASASITISFLILGLIYWVRQQTLRPEVLGAQEAAGMSTPKTKRAIMAGLALPVFLAALLGLMLNGETAHEAIRRAKQQLDGNYRYVVTSMNMRSHMKEKSVVATVAAYNNAELKSIEVSWKE
jgi:hypothetical protein